MNVTDSTRQDCSFYTENFLVKLLWLRLKIFFFRCYCPIRDLPDEIMGRVFLRKKHILSWFIESHDTAILTSILSTLQSHYWTSTCFLQNL